MSSRLSIRAARRCACRPSKQLLTPVPCCPRQDARANAGSRAGLVENWRMMKKLTEWVEWIGEGKLGPLDAAIALAALYCAFQVLTSSLVSHLAGTSVSIDDAEQLIYLPYLWAGYGGSQPPLYTWIVWTATHLLGTSVMTLKIIKYALIFLALFSVNRAVRRLGFSSTTAAAASFGLMTIAQILWESQHTLTHSVAALAFSALALLTLVRLFKSPRPLNYALFGLVAALAILAKFNDIIFLFAMLAAGLSVREFRPAILSRWLLLSGVIVVLGLTPTVLWSYQHPEAILARVYKFGIDQPHQDFFFVRANGLRELAEAIFNFSVLTAVICGASFAAERLNPTARLSGSNPGEKFVGRTLAFGLAALMLLVLVSGTTTIRDRWLMPLLFLLPAYAAIRAQLLGPRGKEVRYHIISVGLTLAVLAIPVTWYAQAMGGKGKSRTVRLDYQALLSDLQADGPVGTILASSSWIGNFRLVDDNLVLLNREVPKFDALLRQPAVLVWLDTDEPETEILDRLRQIGYSEAGQVKTVAVPERFGGAEGRRVSFVRLKKQQPANPAAPD
ncbi:glycosyl transferase family 39 [Mesorhizobium sp. M00.F.Ca.ET.216.01.1.1]|nr:glycosyl transferase family 39 [Mesorhizobium sp. M00.F.Ca.ET.216.01.1.1]